MNLKLKHFFIIFLILLFAIQVQADAPINYNKELASDVELRGTFFTDDNADGFYVSLIGENSIQIDSDTHYIDKTIKIKKTALDSRFKKFNGVNIGVTHISDNGIVNNYISPVIVDGEFVYITVDFSTVIINGMTGITTTTLTGLSGNQSISVPDGSSYDLNITNNQLDLVNATGGVLTTNETDNIHTFTTSGTFTPDNNFNVSYLIVAGGGGGGSRGGGGGAGGFRTNVSHPVSPQAYSITIGDGGAGAGFSADGDEGGDSVFDTITSTGGGGGAGWEDAAPAVGGSGGGGSAYGTNTRPGAAGTGSEGYAGGDGGANDDYDSGGGGGGASEVGVDAISGTAGNGGDGLASSISGSSVTYAGGGGGGCLAGTGGSGGAGGGGDGSHNTNGTNGTINSGSGGGAGGGAGGNKDGGAGGSGIVIIRYNTTLGEGTVNITASVTDDFNTQSYNTSQSREFTLTPTGETNNVLVNTTSTDYDITVTTYWTENITLQTESATAGYAKQYINYTPLFNITSADLNTTFTFNFSAQDYIGAATSTLNDVSKTTTRDGQDVNASVGSLTGATPYWWNVTVPYNNIFTLSEQSDITAYLEISESFTDSTYNDPEGLPVDSRLWKFGDGDTSSSSNPSHTYSNLGDFNANYSVTETATVSPQTIVREFNVSVEVQPPQNITTVPYQTNVSINWDYYVSADKYSVYELEDGFPYVDTNPTVDGVKDAIYDCAHEFLIFSPNPVNPGDYETSYPVRTSLGAYLFHEAVDNDDKLGDDDLIYYWDLDNNGLSVDDPAWKITDNVVKKYLWDGDSWQVTGSTNAIGDSTGGGTHYPKHELFIPIAELGANWTNGSTVKVLVKREDSSLHPDVITWYPYGNVNDTNLALWQEMVLNDPESYTWLANVTLSNYTATNLTPFTIYHGAVSTWNGSHESDYTLFDVITEDIPVYNVSGYVFDDLGNIIAGAIVYSCNGFVHEITQTDIYGYWIGYNFREGNYTICANKSGYSDNSIDIYVSTNLTNQNITIPAFEMTDWMLWEKLLEIEDAIDDLSTDFTPTEGNYEMLSSTYNIFLLLLGACFILAFPKRGEVTERDTGLNNVLFSFLGTILSVFLAQIIVSGQVVESFAFESQIYDPLQHYFLYLIAVIMFVVFVLNVVYYIRQRID